MLAQKRVEAHGERLLFQSNSRDCHFEGRTVCGPRNLLPILPAPATDTTTLQLQQFAQPLRLRTRNGNFAGALVVHFEHEARFKPGHHFLDVPNIHQI